MDVVGDRYELGALLGAGGMARVLEAHDRLLDRQVAVKMLRDDIATDPGVRDRFLREARTAAKFTHPNAVAVYDTGQDGRNPWIVMELIRGEDLSRRLTASGRLDEAEAVRITDAVLAALEAAHRDGMVHRDVKPGNIMLLDDGGVKLADFGIAKSVQEATAGLTATGQVIGTAKYLAPEQVDGKPASPASDVYATGIVLFEMLTGEPPFTGDSAIAVALAHTRQPVPDLSRLRPDLSPGVVAVVHRALAKDPAERYADAGEMRRGLRGESVAAAYAPTAVVSEPTATRVLPPGAAAAGAGRPRRGFPWVVLLLALLALLGGYYLAQMNWGADDPAIDPTPPAEQEQPADDEPEQQPEQPADEPPAEQEPAPPEETPAEEAPPEPEVPTDLPELISLLAANPGVYGEKQDDLRKEAEKVNNHGGEKQAEEARVLQEKVAEWMANEELDPAIGTVTLALLEPLAASGGRGRGRDQAPGQQEDDED